MATIIRKIIFCLCLIMTSNILVAHTIYAPNDIPLLDNRFRIDPFTEQITFILNHAKKPQLVILVRPDGSKIHYKKHPKSVSWVTNNDIDIITIDNPMPGPWQAIAELNGNNRIKLVSKVKLTTNKLPLKLYAQEYITTHASLYLDDKLMTDKNYLNGAKLSIRLIGKEDKHLTLYKDDGKSYDALPFDGTLTAHIYINLKPGRYLLNIRTKNNVFIRNQNKDAVVFPSPITYESNAVGYGSKEALFTFRIDNEELDPESISINGIIKDDNNKVVGQFIAHSAGKISTDGVFTSVTEIDYGSFTLSGKAYATTRSGREIELQLPSQHLELIAKVVMPPITTHVEKATEVIVQEAPPSIWSNIWVIIAIVTSILFLILAIAFIFVRHRTKSKKTEHDEKLSLSKLEPESIDLSSPKK